MTPDDIIFNILLPLCGGALILLVVLYIAQFHCKRCPLDAESMTIREIKRRTDQRIAERDQQWRR